MLAKAPQQTRRTSVCLQFLRSSFAHFHTEQAEIFPIDIKLDYKPRRVDYRALREGKTIELMNFFHFDGSEMTLRHITLSGASMGLQRSINDSDPRFR